MIGLDPLALRDGRGSAALARLLVVRVAVLAVASQAILDVVSREPLAVVVDEVLLVQQLPIARTSVKNDGFCITNDEFCTEE